MRILYVQATFVPPPADPMRDRFFLLSENLEGDVLQPVWFRTPQEIEEVFGPGSYPIYTAGRFRYHWFLTEHYRGIWQRLAIFRFYLRKGLELHRRQPFDCIIAYSHMTTGLIAGLLKILTRTRLIIEIATSPKQVYLTERPKPTLFDRLRHLYSDISLHLSMFLADRAHFLCPGQLDGYPLLRRVRNSVFHEFVTVASIKRPDSEEAEPFVLLVGAPWYLKGADLLVEAFLRLESDFPNVKLKLLGHDLGVDQMKELIGASKRIEIFKAVPNPEALRMISKASVLVLASRCEGMGRVLIEAMAAGVPLIGSNVGGIPYIVRDGENGFVFPVGDSHTLEARLRQLLADAELRRKMGERGYVRAHEELDERAYVKQFSRMVEATIHAG
jgi:glycosyltransferase involved in cell wall biosynthesis